MTPAIVDFGSCVRGDTIDAKQFSLTRTVDGSTSIISLVGAEITVTFYNNRQRITKTIDNGITVTDAATGVFVLDKFSLEVAGNWSYDIQLIFANGDVKTYIVGSINIKNDITI